MNLETKVKKQTDVINSNYVRFIDSLIRTLEAKDFYTRGHSQRVTRYSVAIAEELGMAGQKLEELHRASVLHDLGKIGIKEAILNKPGRLTEEEFSEVVRHPEKAVEILEPIDYYSPLPRDPAPPRTVRRKGVPGTPCGETSPSRPASCRSPIPSTP